MGLLAVSAIGADRPGIVAAVTGVLVEAGCNLEDTSMTILRGHFAMTLVVAGELTASELEDRLRPEAERLDLRLSVRDIDHEPDHPSAHPYVVSVYGADQPGIVHRVTSLLADRGVNITDLTTRLVGDAQPLYAMVLEVDVPASLGPDRLESEVKALAAEMGADASVHAAEPDIL